MSDEQNIIESQEMLGKALERARMGEDRDLASWVRERGERFVRVLFGLLRMTNIHSLDNNAFTKPMRDIGDVVSDLMDTLGAVHLVTVEDQVFLNDIRLRMGRDEGGDLGSELRRHGVGGISFHSAPTEAQMRVFVELFSGPPQGDSPRLQMMEQFTARGYDGLDLFGVYRFRISGEEDSRPVKRDLAKISTRATELVDESWDNLSSERMPNPLPMRRIVTEILESEAGGDGLMSEATRGSSFGAHTLQVCQIALILARAAKLSDEAIQDIGVAAMFHDMGYAAREGADPALNDPGYPPPFERHAAAGARLLLRQRGFHQAKIARALCTLEHHRDYNDSRGIPSLFGRVMRIAEDYTNLLRRRAGGFSPREALQKMASLKGKAYDPVLLQVFINALGAYPPGTLLELQGGYVVVSRSLCRSPQTFDKPIARLLRLPDGTEPPRLMRIDLAQKGRIVRVLRDLPETTA
ncbi:MAG: HD domain-containing protein [Myxococcota bacterium]|nr:HD domain-containing protein [Myxococcota bacterium]